MLLKEPLRENRQKDSPFAYGTALSFSRLPGEIEARNFSDRTFKVLHYLEESEFMVVSALVHLIKASRFVVSKSLTCLWYAGLVRWITVSANNSIFKLWMTSNTKPPKYPNEACRMAALSLYYALAKSEVPGFSWKLIKNPKMPLLAEMSYIARNNGIQAKMIIDAPRRGEKPWPDANLFIFPTIKEASLAKKRFTSDIHLIENNGIPLNKRIFEILK